MFLIIDTSHLLSIGVLLHTRESHICIANKHRHESNIISYIDSLIKMYCKSTSDIQHVFVGTGPGSFVGTRVGEAVAKGISYGCNVRLSYFDSMLAVPLQMEMHDRCAVFRYISSNYAYLHKYECDTTTQKYKISYACNIGKIKDYDLHKALNKYDHIFVNDTDSARYLYDAGIISTMINSININKVANHIL